MNDWWEFASGPPRPLKISRLGWPFKTCTVSILRDRPLYLGVPKGDRRCGKHPEAVPDGVYRLQANSRGVAVHAVRQGTNLGHGVIKPVRCTELHSYTQSSRNPINRRARSIPVIDSRLIPRHTPALFHPPSILGDLSLTSITVPGSALSRYLIGKG